eukprot:752805-Hanusia_phi.AAC.2
MSGVTDLSCITYSRSLTSKIDILIACSAHLTPVVLSSSFTSSRSTCDCPRTMLLTKTLHRITSRGIFDAPAFSSKKLQEMIGRRSLRHPPAATCKQLRSHHPSSTIPCPGTCRPAVSMSCEENQGEGDQRRREEEGEETWKRKDRDVEEDEKDEERKGGGGGGQMEGDENQKEEGEDEESGGVG